MMARYDQAAATPTIAAEQMSAFITAMSPLVYHSLFVRFEISAEGSNVRVPATWGGITEWGGSEADPDEAPFFWSYTGKDITGRRFRLEMFGRGRDQGDGWRLQEVDDTSVGDALAVLETEEAVFLTIAGNTPIFNRYANKSVSQHWVGEIR